MIDVRVISLDGDTTRYEMMREQFTRHEGARVSRSRGVYGGTLPSLACGVLTRARHYKERIGGGTLGVFLAHVAVWEHIAASDDDFSLVLEDDVFIRNFSALIAADLPADADIVFCHDLMQPSSDRCSEKMEFIALDEGLRTLARSGSRAVGSCGYILRKSGAAKLLAAVERDLFFGHVDWQLLRYCVTDTQLDRAIADSEVASILRNRGPLHGYLHGYVTLPAVVFGRGMASRRAEEDRLASVA